MHTLAAIASLPEAPIELNGLRTGVERRGNIGHAEFVREYLEPRTPVVLTEVTSGWKAMERWTPEFFAEQFGDRKVELLAGKKAFRATFRWFAGYLRKQSFSVARTATAPSLYLRNVLLFQTLPELLDDFHTHELFLPDWFELWPIRRLYALCYGAAAQLFIGPAAVSFPIVHRDRMATHSWIAQIYGLKQLWLVSPAESHLMYQTARDPDHSAINSLRSPDYERFPLLRQATIHSVVLRPGETLFLPAGWWHTADCLTTSIGISANFINRTNFSEFIAAIRSDPDAFTPGNQFLKLFLLNFAGKLLGMLFPGRKAAPSGPLYRLLRNSTPSKLAVPEA